MNKQLRLYLILLLLVGSGMYLLRYSPTPEENLLRDWSEIEQEGVLRIAVDYNSVEFRVDADSLVGFQYELGRSFAQSLGVEMEIHPVGSLSEMMEGLEQGSYDLIARRMPITLALRERYGVSDPIFTSRQLLVQRKAAYNNDSLPLRNQLHLARKVLHLPANSPVMSRLQNLMKEIGDTIYVVEDPLYQDEQLLQRVALGEIEFAVCDALVAAKMAQHYPQIDMDTDIGFSQLNAWLLRKESPDLLEQVNLFLSDAKQKGVINQLIQRYF